ncbi:MAG: hypothetical protein KDC12_12520, partial [Flavobacteriales bacterium]|nr:hypothetical protein [Flavobacteriales bacterium]
MLKRTLILFSAFCATWSVQAQTFTVVSETENEMVIEASFPEPEMNTISTQEGEAVVFTMPDANPILRKGAPEVPHYAKSVVIDRKARMEMEIIESTYQIINDVTVAPSKGNLYRNVDPASMPFVFGPAYQTSASYPANIAELGEVYIFRDYRGQVVEFNPIQVVGAEQKVRVYSHIKVRISKTDEIGDNPMPATVQGRPTEQYNELYGNRFINFNSGVQRYDVVDELGKMLIIADAEYMTTLEPFIQWKKEKGMDIILTDIADIGNSVSAISNHIADTYDAENLSYVLLVGDEDQVTSELVSNGGGNGYCDPCYGYLTGNDHFPEVLVGRFLVHDTNELERVITKTLEYEIDPYTATDWFSTAIGIGSNEGAGNGDDGEADWQHNNNIKSDLIDYNYNTVWELYDGNHTANSPTGGATADGSGNPSASTLIGLIEDGCTMINYTGHGDHDIIVTTSYDNNDIYNTNNNHFYPFMVVVGCCVGDFDETYGSGDCFGEAWLKGNNSGPITGGIGGGFSSVLQSWAPPMEAQDEMNKLICETGQQNIRHSLGSILFHGCASMIEAYGSGGNEMMDTWCFFGDPSVVMRTAFPSTLTATHDASTFIGVSEITVNCNTEDALICATWEGEILGTALVSGGLANITFNQAVNGVGQILITATAYNTIPYQGTMDVVPADGPYVIDEDIAVDDSNGNNNDQVDYNESVMMDISVVNVGIETAFGVSATLTTMDSWITITDDNHYYGDITPDAVEFGNGGYAFDVADGVEDQHIAMFTLNIEDTDGNTWTMNFNVVINAPELDTAEMLTIDDSSGNNNGRLDSGESVTITIPTMNDGHSASVEAIGDLSVSGGYLTIDQSSVTLGTINAD